MVLCVQIAKDTWRAWPSRSAPVHLLKICDIAELLQRHPGMDWGSVLADTRRLGGRRILWFGLRLAWELLGTALPQDVLQQMQGHPSVGVLAACIRAQFFHTADERGTTPLSPARFRWAIRERVQDKIFPYLISLPSAKRKRSGSAAAAGMPLWALLSDSTSPGGARLWTAPLARVAKNPMTKRSGGIQAG